MNLETDEVMLKYWPTHSYATKVLKSQYCMTLSLVIMLTEIITMLKSFAIIRNFLFSIEKSWNVVYAMILILGLAIFGLSLCNMALFGSQNLGFNNIGTAMLYTVYAPPYLIKQSSIMDVHKLIFRLFTAVFHQIVWQILVFAMFCAVMFDAYRNILIANGKT